MVICSDFFSKRFRYHIRCSLSGGEILISPMDRQLLSSSTQTSRKGSPWGIYLNLGEYFSIHSPGNISPHPQMQVRTFIWAHGWHSPSKCRYLGSCVSVCPRLQCLSYWHTWDLYHEDYSLLLVLLLVLLLLLLKSQLKPPHHMNPAAGPSLRLTTISGKLEGLVVPQVGN